MTHAPDDDWVPEPPEGPDDAPWVPPRATAPDRLDAAHYPAPIRERPPAELSRRQRRHWRRDARHRQRTEAAATVRTWRDRPPGSVDGLASILLVAALVVAGHAFWPGDEPAREDRPAAASTSSAPGLPAAPTGATRSTATPTPAPTSGAEPTGTDDDPPPAAPDVFRAPGGEVAFPFLLAYNTYSPANPDPTTAWIDTWSSWATDEVRDAARNGASRLWDSTVRRQVTVVAPVVLDGTVTAGSDQSTFEVEVQRQLFPIGGGPETPTTPEVVRWRVVVTGTGTPTPLVANATALTGTTTAEDDSGVGG